MARLRSRRKEEREGGLPQLVASILRIAEPRFFKRASKIKLKIDVASKHPAPACASLTLPPYPPLPVPGPPLGCANEHRKLLYIQSILAAPNRLCSFHTLIITPTCPPSLQPQNRAWVWSMVIVIPKTNWPSFNSTEKCKKLAPQKPGCLRSVCGATIQHNHTALINSEEPIRLQGGFLDLRIWTSYIHNFPLTKRAEVIFYEAALQFIDLRSLWETHITSHRLWRENNARSAQLCSESLAESGK